MNEFPVDKTFYASLTNESRIGWAMRCVDSKSILIVYDEGGGTFTIHRCHLDEYGPDKFSQHGWTICSEDEFNNAWIAAVSWILYKAKPQQIFYTRKKKLNAMLNESKLC